MFRAYHPEQDKLVAVKLFKLDVAPERAHKLVAELEALIDTDLTHPSIAAPFAAGLSDVSAYLAQDFVAADSVDVVARAHGPAPPHEALRVASQLAAALDYAADALVFHGAMHPRDVLVSPDEARLTGLGIAHALEKIDFIAPIRRPYTAPERAAGRQWDRRADVFSLAAIIHELIWGRRITALGEEAARSLTAVEGTDLDALRDLFARALAQDPVARLETASEFAAGLKAALSPVVVSGFSRTEDLPIESSPPMKQFELVVDEELPFPLDEPEIVIDRGDPEVIDSDFDVAKVFAAEAPPVEPPPPRVEAEQPVAAAQMVEPVAYVEREPEPPPAAHEPPPVVIPASAFESFDSPSRSAVWPLALALGLGLAVGFAVGYASAGRTPPELSVEAHTDAAVAPTMATTEKPGPVVAETEVRLPPAAAPDATGTSGAGDIRLKPDPTTTMPAPEPARTTAEEVRPNDVRLKPDATNAAPVPTTGRLLIRSTPAGATAYVDGREAGKTPLTVNNVRRGTHTVRVVREGFTAAQRRVTVAAARSQSVTFALNPARPPAPAPPPAAARATSVVTVESRPAGATVILDGKPVGRTPLKLNQVEVGDHPIAIELDGYRRWAASVRVVAGEPARVTASLER